MCRTRIKRHRVSRVENMTLASMMNFQLTVQHVQKFIPRMDMCPHIRPFFQRNKFGKVGIQTAIRQREPQTFKVISRHFNAALRHPCPFLFALNFEHSIRFRLKKIRKVFCKHSGNPRQVTECGYDSARFQLRKKARRQSRLASHFHQAHRSFQSQALDALADLFFRNVQLRFFRIDCR